VAATVPPALVPAALSGLGDREVADRLGVRPVDAARLMRTALTRARAKLDRTRPPPPP